jgi:hypothetical protein
MSTPYTYGDLRVETKASIWPNGVPENLVTAIDRIILQAINWLQQNVECLRDEHLDVTSQCSTIFHCGITVIDKPDGVINRLFTVQHSGFCDPVKYDERTKDEVLEWSRRFMKFVTSPTNAGMTKLPGGFKFAESSTNDEYGRAMYGLWAKDRSRILIAPWLQSYEDVAVEWTGFKNTWADSDLVIDAPDFKRAVKLFVQREFARDFDRDPGFAQMCNDDLQGNPPRGIYGAVPALIQQCREKRRQRKSVHDHGETDYLILNYEKPDTVTETETSTVVAGIGDYGLDGTNLTAVAALVKSWSPDQIITLGNNNFLSGDAGTIDANVGKHFYDYITPYTGIYGVERGVNRFWPSLGNVDLDTEDGQPYYDYFSLPNNERYYEKEFGHIHFFFIDSGYDSDGVLIEPDGNSEDSDQANWILMRALRSTVKWKIAVFNSPPYSSQTDIAKTAMRWNFARYGFDAVLSAGGSKSYERFEVDGFPYIVNGIGGAGLEAFPGAESGSEFQYAANYGALKITATCSELLFSLRDVDDAEIDSLTIT